MNEFLSRDESLLFAASEALTGWYQKNARTLPWRRDKDPYRVWLSEIMLQQTRVETVIPYYERFLAALPNLHALAGAEEDVLLKLWEGLGYYSRARNLSAAAKQIIRECEGIFPDTVAALRRLPGVGEYTAGAIASICYALPEPAVDGNVLRVCTRLLKWQASVDEPKTKQALRTALVCVYERTARARRGDLTQALMELGALVCVPNAAPVCAVCPLRALCRAHRDGAASSLPVRTKKTEKREELRTVFLLRIEDRIALRRRPGKGLLAGLWELPNADGALNPAEAEAQLIRWGLSSRFLRSGPSRTHTFTHIRWRMNSYVASCAQEDGLRGASDFVWVSLEELDAGYALPSAFAGFLSEM